MWMKWETRHICIYVVFVCLSSNLILDDSATAIQKKNMIGSFNERNAFENALEYKIRAECP